MNTIGVVIISWIAVAFLLGRIVFRLTPSPLEVKDEMVLLGTIAARSFFFAYLFAPYVVTAPFVGIIAPASLFIPAILMDTDPGREAALRGCMESIGVAMAIFATIYVVRQVAKRKWP